MPISFSSLLTERVPAWLLEVEELRRDPSVLADAVSFTSPDDPMGRIELGPSVDEPSGEDVDAWEAPP